MTPADPPGSNAASGWDDFQTVYWNSIANDYDGLYASAWSRRENDLLRRSLAELIDEDDLGTIVDLGCGRGLTHGILQRIGALATYIGVDISLEMLARSAAPKGHLVCAPMDKLGFITTDAASSVVASFSSASYAEDIPAMFAEVARVLRPGGTAYLSFLSSYAPSRLSRWHRSHSVYRTRGDRRAWAVVPAHRMSRRRLLALAEGAGLVVEAVRGVNALSGLLEAPRLWRAGRAVARIAPSLSHTIELVVRAR